MKKRLILSALTLTLLAGVLCGCGRTQLQPAAAAPAQQETAQEPQQKSEPSAPENFVLLADVVPDAMEEIRYYTTYNFTGMRVDGYEEPCALLTREAAEALRAVSDEVKARGYRLKIYDAYRPQAAVQCFVRWAEDPGDTEMKPYFYPEVDKSQLFAQGYIAGRSGHSRGSTVDLTLFDEATGKLKFKARTVLPGSWPRDFIFLNDTLAIVTMERSNEVHTLRYDAEKGTFSVLGTCSGLFRPVAALK